MKALITGGAGFIGSALTRHIVQTMGASAVAVDALTYAGHLSSLAPVAGYDGYQLYAPPPRYVYPGGAPPRYYMRLNKQRAAALKKRRTAIREYYSPY